MAIAGSNILIPRREKLWQNDTLDTGKYLVIKKVIVTTFRKE